MKFLLVLSLAAIAIILASRKSREAEDYADTMDEDSETYPDDEEIPHGPEGRTILDDQLAYSEEEIISYSEPSPLRSSDRFSTGNDDFQRPEYLSEDKPVMETDAESETSEAPAEDSKQRY